MGSDIVVSFLRYGAIKFQSELSDPVKIRGGMG